jgi:hypothetical protein
VPLCPVVTHQERRRRRVAVGLSGGRVHEDGVVVQHSHDLLQTKRIELTASSKLVDGEGPRGQHIWDTVFDCSAETLGVDVRCAL